MFLLAVFVLWAVIRLLLSDGPRHMNGYDLIRSSEASWHQWNGKGFPTLTPLMKNDVM